MGNPDYSKICFVVMPFGKRAITNRKKFFGLRAQKVDFDSIYTSVFAPAIEAVELPEGGKLRVRRADKDYYAGIINEEMFAYLEYSRIVLADISSVNANVFYELGVRHRARSAGTAVFRQVDAAIPFDINQVRTFPYEYQPEASARESRHLITSVLEVSLRELRIDSPVQLAIKRQQLEATAHPQLESLLRDAENYVRTGDKTASVAKLELAVNKFNGGPLVRQKLALMYRDRGDWDAALAQLDLVVAEMPTFPDAYREKGIAENKRYQKARKANNTVNLPTGEESLRRAVSLSPMDYDARSSLAGVLKREGRFEEAFALYREASDISRGHPYPLLNEIKTQAAAGKGFALDEKRKLQLERAARMRSAQTEDRPPSDAPWCFFDLAEISLYLGDAKGFREISREGIKCSDSAWQICAFREGLELLLRNPVGDGAIDLETVTEMIEELQKAESFLA
jgi:tetratricopeptide (TPR) repeat protein